MCKFNLNSSTRVYWRYKHKCFDWDASGNLVNCGKRYKGVRRHTLRSAKWNSSGEGGKGVFQFLFKSLSDVQRVEGGGRWIAHRPHNRCPFTQDGGVWGGGGGKKVLCNISHNLCCNIHEAETWMNSLMLITILPYDIYYILPSYLVYLQN